MTAAVSYEEWAKAATSANIAPPGASTHPKEALPPGWQKVRLTEVAKLESGHTPSRTQPRYWNGGIPWISLHDTEALDRKEIFFTNRTVTHEGIANSSARLLPRGTVVFSRTATVGKSTVMGREMATSQDFANYVCSPKVHNHFLVHLFRFMAPHWKRLMAGSIHNTVYMPVFEKLEVTLPPRPEQEAIAAALEDVDILLAQLDALIAKKRDLKQAAMQQLLTGRTRLGGFTRAWDMRKFGELARPRTQRFDSRRAGRAEFCIELEHIEQASGRLTGYCMADGESSLKTIFDVGDVLFGKLRAYLRKYWLANRAGVCSTEIWALAPNEKAVSAPYLFQLVQMDSFIDAAATAYGTHMPRSDWNVVEKYELAVPDVHEQTAIAPVLSDMDAETAVLEARRDKTCALKQGMMQELLTGRIRLI